MADVFASELGTSNPLQESELEALYPHLILVIQKNPALFDISKSLFGIPLSDLKPNADIVWKHLPGCIMASFLQGNVKDKLSSLLAIVKSFLSANPDPKTAEISRILNEDSTQGSLESFLEFCTNTRIAKVLDEILSAMDVSELETLLKNPADFIEVAKNPDHPIVKSFIHKFQTLMKEKVQKGHITQHQITQDVEGIKSKLMSMFGSAMGDILGTRADSTPAPVLLSNSPEARRQRILARLQRKSRS